MNPETTARRYIIALDFAEAYEAALRILARDERELKEYQERPDHNPKAASIRQERQNTLLRFVEITREAMALQGQHIEAAAGLEHELRTLKEEHEKLKAYARSKGLVLDVLPYMYLNEFRRAGL